VKERRQPSTEAKRAKTLELLSSKDGGGGRGTMWQRHYTPTCYGVVALMLAVDVDVDVVLDLICVPMYLLYVCRRIRRCNRSLSNLTVGEHLPPGTKSVDRSLH